MSVRFFKFICVCLLLLGSFSLSAEPAAHHIVATLVFEGDSQGDFVGNFIAVLDDDSCWKVHPTQQELYQNWSGNDEVHVGFRTDFYWFKREHKFELVNHTRNETVKVMIVNYPRNGLRVVSGETYVASSYPSSHTVTDSRGYVTTTYHTVYNYARRVILSDGSIWTVKENLAQFLTGSEVYVAVNKGKTIDNYYLITGKERYSMGTWAVIVD